MFLCRPQFLDMFYKMRKNFLEKTFALSYESFCFFKGALAATVVDGWIYAVGGSISNAALKHAERYDPVTDQWTSVPKMRLQRSHFGLASLDGKIYAIGKCKIN